MEYLLIAFLCLIAHRLGWIHGKRAGRREGYDDGWKKREAYGNGGRRQWWNRKIKYW